MMMSEFFLALSFFTIIVSMLQIMMLDEYDSGVSFAMIFCLLLGGLFGVVHYVIVLVGG